MLFSSLGPRGTQVTSLYESNLVEVSTIQGGFARYICGYLPDMRLCWFGFQDKDMRVVALLIQQPRGIDPITVWRSAVIAETFRVSDCIELKEIFNAVVGNPAAIESLARRAGGKDALEKVNNLLPPQLDVVLEAIVQAGAKLDYTTIQEEVDRLLPEYFSGFRNAGILPPGALALAEKLLVS